MFTNYLLGQQFESVIELCACKPDVFFFVKQRLWPSTPSFPRIAFEFKFMDLLESFFLESQVSVSSFCASMTLLAPPLQRINVNVCCHPLACKTHSIELYSCSSPTHVVVIWF